MQLEVIHVQYTMRMISLNSKLVLLRGYKININLMSASLSKMLAAFQSKGFLRHSPISQPTFFSIVDELLGWQFDRQVANQIWQQADLNQSYQAQVQQLCEIIQDAQNILTEKVHQTSQKIQKLVIRQRQLDSDQRVSPQRKQLELQEIARELADLQRDRIEFSQDLYFITAPFGINPSLQQGPPRPPGPFHTSRPNANIANPIVGHTVMDDTTAKMALQNKPGVANQINPSNINFSNPTGIKGFVSGLNQPVPPPSSGLNNSLMYLFWLAVFIGLLEIVVMFKKSNFLNLLAVCCVMSVFLLNYFDQYYIKACLILTALSVILDFSWLLLYGSIFWSPPRIGQFATSQADYLRLIVLFTVMSMVLKVPLAMMLFRHKDISMDSNYVVDMGKLHVFANKRNLVSQSIAQAVIKRQPSVI